MTAKQLELITDCVMRYPGLRRQELANTLCEWFGWYRPNGRLKARECRELLQQLHQRSMIDLPRLRAGRPQNSRTMIPNTMQGDADEALQVSLSEVQPIRIRRVELRADHQYWRELVGRHHYLGYRTAYGASVRYLIETAFKQPGILGCLQFSSAAWQRVKKNAGAAGIDRMTVGEFAQREEFLLALIHDKLQSGTYRFQPAKRVLIPIGSGRCWSL